jgi:D-sedoheptulose 7-phosphate isomerase
MTEKPHAYLKSSARLIEATVAHLPEARVEAAIDAMVRALSAGRPMLVCGNGGSAADAMHIAGELVGRYLKERKALRVVSLADNPATLTAWGNDYSFDTVFARQVEGIGEKGGVLWGLSTSGNSPNVVKAFEAARKIGMVTVALTGQGGGKLAPLADHLLDVPSRTTPMIQQVHICLYHHICERIEARLFP